MCGGNWVTIEQIAPQAQYGGSLTFLSFTPLPPEYETSEARRVSTRSRVLGTTHGPTDTQTQTVRDSLSPVGSVVRATYRLRPPPVLNEQSGVKRDCPIRARVETDYNPEGLL